jgi:hypothetical protein
LEKLSTNTQGSARTRATLLEVEEAFGVLGKLLKAEWLLKYVTTLFSVESPRSMFML